MYKILNQKFTKIMKSKDKTSTKTPFYILCVNEHRSSR